MPVETLSGTLMGRCVTPISEDHGEKYGVPSLEELGEENSHFYGDVNSVGALIRPEAASRRLLSLPSSRWWRLRRLHLLFIQLNLLFIHKLPAHTHTAPRLGHDPRHTHTRQHTCWCLPSSGDEC